MLSRSDGVARSSGRAWSTTLYSSPRSTKVVTMREPSMVSSVRPTAVSDTPRSKARSRSMLTLILGFCSKKSERRPTIRGFSRRTRSKTWSRQLHQLLVAGAAEHDLQRLAAAADAEARRQEYLGRDARESGRASAGIPAASSGRGLVALAPGSRAARRRSRSSRRRRRPTCRSGRPPGGHIRPRDVGLQGCSPPGAAGGPCSSASRLPGPAAS